MKKEWPVRTCPECGRSHQRKSRSKYCSQDCLLNYCWSEERAYAFMREEAKRRRLRVTETHASARTEGGCTVYVLAPGEVRSPPRPDPDMISITDEDYRRRKGSDGRS
jgi:hypothetical protein